MDKKKTNKSETAADKQETVVKPKKVKKTYLIDAIQAVGNGQTITVAETRALGCGIKFAEK